MMTQAHRSIFFPGILGLALGAGVLGIGALAPPPAHAQQLASPERSNYTPLDAAADSFDRAEAKRLGQVNAQIGLNQQMRWRWTGMSSFYPGVFEPWPMIPGDIWGYPLPIFNVRQSVGQRSYQAGPNRWISEPVYPEDLAQGDPASLGAAPAVGSQAPAADPTDLFGGPAPNAAPPAPQNAGPPAPRNAAPAIPGPPFPGPATGQQFSAPRAPFRPNLAPQRHPAQPMPAQPAAPAQGPREF